MKYFYIHIYFLSFAFLFDIDDWHYIKKIGSIYSIIQDDEFIHFIADNGIYSYDDLQDEFYYNFNLSNAIDFNNEIYFFYFDSNTNMYWFVDDYSIKMKHSLHDFWSEISFSRLDINLRSLVVLNLFNNETLIGYGANLSFSVLQCC